MLQAFLCVVKISLFLPLVIVYSVKNTFARKALFQFLIMKNLKRIVVQCMPNTLTTKNQ